MFNHRVGRGASLSFWLLDASSAVPFLLTVDGVCDVEVSREVSSAAVARSLIPGHSFSLTAGVDLQLSLRGDIFLLYWISFMFFVCPTAAWDLPRAGRK